jgi:integrase
MQPWVLHDLRRTAASSLAALGVQLPVIEKVLNHQSGSFRGVCGVYQRHRYAAEKKAALDLWAAHVSNLIPAPGIGLPLAA